MLRKHAAAKQIEVELTDNRGAVHLTIRDSGVGFNVEAAKRGTGLGLTSMQERVRLCGGTLVIHSSGRTGTCIDVQIPHNGASEETLKNG